ncbi:hypothetical protein C7441_12177 [Pseudaminobacter salicylatoxidans]|uniref:ArnR1-like winged helix-turn-helix domain-containing protein n=1 Tax=Pseudaminobacter salicylatoxidans TaxID=93369 RepID=A0A316BP46_PSESE|nr:hypothetical protein [Pseudaminobacter salicylatoxidans]PWJ75294.1 hypothetical protein C7441_12177 [Pseudaminobacter salicylatoxidans]
MDCIFPHEVEALEMLAGLRPRTSDAWIKLCLENLSREGLCTEGPNYRLTQAGKAYLTLVSGSLEPES